MAVTGALRGREDLLPVVLHADDGPAVLLRLVVERLRKGTELGVRQSLGRAVGVFARGIVVKHQQHEARAGAALRVFQHLLVATGVSEGGDRPPADVLVDADGLVGLVVIEVQFRQAQENGLAVAHLEPCLDAAADDLFGRDAVGLLRPWPHELDAAARDDEVLEAVRPQVGEQFDHGLVGHVGEQPAGLGMLRGGDPVLHDLLEFHRGHAGVGGHHEVQDRAVAAGQRSIHVALEQRGERFLGLPFRMLRRQRLHAIEREVELDGHRLLAPQRAVVVERGDAFWRRHEVRRAGPGDLFDEGDDGGFRRPVVPRGQGIALGEGRRAEDEQRGRQQRQKSAFGDHGEASI